MPDVKWAIDHWNNNNNWPDQDGEGWSIAWGSARAQWVGTIFPRISPWLPALRILEIAPGRGRWTKFLLHQSSEYFGVDVASNCIEICSKRFSSHPDARFYVNDGYSLECIADNSIDLVFSFEALVHVEFDVIEAYCKQIITKLTPKGAAFIHHSNAKKEFDPLVPDFGNRAMTVSSQLVKESIESNSGKVLLQEEINIYGTTHRVDCLTTFCRKDSVINYPYKLLLNNQYMEEADIIRKYQSKYSNISRSVKDN